MAFQKFFAGELAVHDSSVCRYLIVRKFTEQDEQGKRRRALLEDPILQQHVCLRLWQVREAGDLGANGSKTV